MTVFANRTGRTTVRAAFSTFAVGTSSIQLASPYFSYSDAIERLVKKGRSVFLIVRLGSGTPPNHLGHLLQLPSVQVRFFNDRKFHTKLYIFGDSVALVGSANLTESGLQRNREVAVSIDSDRPEFEDLVALFDSYWSQAAVLTDERLERYRTIWGGWNVNTADKQLESSLKKEFGVHIPGEGVQVGMDRPSGEKLYLEDFRRKYQAFLQAFGEVRQVYGTYDTRKRPELPLRVEIHEFLSFVRQNKCPKETWAEVGSLRKSEREKRIKAFLDEWFVTEWSYLDTVAGQYSLLNERLGSPEEIAKANKEELLEALWACHAFREQLRFHEGGADAFKDKFRQDVSTDKLKRSLTYLYYGDDEYVERIATLIFDHSYKISHIGRNGVQELYGWVNSEDIPLSNSRVRKALQCVGFDVRV